MEKQGNFSEKNTQYQRGSNPGRMHGEAVRLYTKAPRPLLQTECVSGQLGPRNQRRYTGFDLSRRGRHYPLTAGAEYIRVLIFY